MRTLLIVTLTIVTGIIFSTNAFALNKNEDIYGGKVDQMISFYQARLHLLDSEYKILSDIGEDALKMIDYLQQNRVQLMEEMKEKQFYRVTKIRSYIVNKARVHLASLEKADKGLEFSRR